MAQHFFYMFSRWVFVGVGVVVVTVYSFYYMSINIFLSTLVLYHLCAYLSLLDRVWKGSGSLRISYSFRGDISDKCPPSQYLVGVCHVLEISPKWDITVVSEHSSGLACGLWHWERDHTKVFWDFGEQWLTVAAAVTENEIGRGPKYKRVRFWSLELEETPCRFFWVLGKDHLP